MSLAAQEQALFDLLFDAPLRARFARESVAALAGYDLDESERADFATVRPDALELDARLRGDFLLSHLCRAFPLSFSLAATLPRGLDLLRELIDAPLMRTAPVRRPAEFGRRLRTRLAQERLSSTQEQAAALALVEAELGMAMTAETVRESVLAGAPPPPPPTAPESGWQDFSLALAPHVSAALLPCSWPRLKGTLCPCADTELWDHLNTRPPAVSLRARALAPGEPRVLLSRARCSRASACDVDVDHATLELGEGFAPLLQHVDGHMSTRAILALMRAVGAPEHVLQGIETAFRQLLGAGMLVPAP